MARSILSAGGRVLSQGGRVLSLRDPIIQALVNNHTNRVVADGGTVDDSEFLYSLFNFLYYEDLLSEVYVMYHPLCGVKKRIDGPNIFCEKIYDLKNNLDSLSTPDNNQPSIANNAFTFNGISQYFSISTGIIGKASIYVHLQSNSTSRQSICSGMIDGHIIHFDRAGRVGSGFQDIAGVATNQGGFANGDYFHLYCHKNGTNNYLFKINDTDRSGGPSSGFRNTSVTLIGSSVAPLYLLGAIKEFIVFNRQLTTSEQTSLFNYFL